MIVRCGRCQAELEVAGPGEFICPACGTRNAVRGAPQAPATGPFDLSAIGAPAAPPPAGAEPAPGVDWSTCPSCSWRFAHGETERITCPNCRAELKRGPSGLQVAS